MYTYAFGFMDEIDNQTLGTHLFIHLQKKHTVGIRPLYEQIGAV